MTQPTIAHGRAMRPVLVALIGMAVGLGWRAESSLSQTPEEEAVAMAQQLLDGINAKDEGLLRRAMHPGARLVAVADPGQERPVLQSSLDQFVERVVGSDDELLERMWEPEVRVDGPIATVWAPYDFHVNGAFSHCGIDAFQLIRASDGWRVVSIIYTMHPQSSCEPSPLGPPGRSG